MTDICFYLFQLWRQNPENTIWSINLLFLDPHGIGHDHMFQLYHDNVVDS